MEKYNKKKIDPELRNEGLFGKSLPFIFSSKVILKLTNKLLHRSAVKNPLLWKNGGL